VRKAAEVTGVVVGCAEDMKALWEDSGVQEMLRRKKIRMEEEPGLYVITLSLLPPFTPSLLHCRGGFRFTDSETRRSSVGQLLE
jgi:hypothetical protein